MSEKVSLKELCLMLSISTATGKNWVKLGKIIPETDPDGRIRFEKSYVEKLKADLKSGENTFLKSRRNKKYVSGNKLYKSYVSPDSENVQTVRDLIDYTEKNSIKLTNEKIAEIVSCCAFSLVKNSIAGENLKEYLPLIDDVSSEYKNSEFNQFGYVYKKDEDTLGLLYISLKNIGERKSGGSYYTPTNIVQKLCGRLELEKNKTVYDPCCGTGNFLLHLNTDFENIYGNDIDKLSVKIARINMAVKFGITDKELLSSHITNYDFLEHNYKNKYDFIIGNPPWCADGALKYDSLYKEIYDAVTDKSLTLLNNNGILSFVLPEAVLNVKTHKTIRKIISENNSIKYLEYIGNAFDGVQCPSVIVQILHNNKPFNTAGMRVVIRDKEFVINTSREINYENFNFTLNDDEYSLLEKIENIPNKVTLKNNSVFALGIVTGNNSKYLSDIKTTKNEMVLKGANIHKYNYENSKTYIKFIPQKFQQVAPSELYRCEKLFYKFISKEPIFAYDDKKTLSLNSCNILIPRIDGLDIKYVLAILNSRIIQFYFRGKYNSIKVLRSHIESFPIPYIGRDKQRIFITYVDKILDRGYSDIIYNQIDEHVAELFGLNREEYSLISLCQS